MTFAGEWNKALANVERELRRQKPLQAFAQLLGGTARIGAALQAIDAAPSGEALARCAREFDAVARDELDALKDAASGDPVPRELASLCLRGIGELEVLARSFAQEAEEWSHYVGDSAEEARRQVIKQAEHHLALRKRLAVESAERLKAVEAAREEVRMLRDIAEKQAYEAQQAVKRADAGRLKDAQESADECRFDAQKTLAVQRAKVEANSGETWQRAMHAFADLNKLPDDFWAKHEPVSRKQAELAQQNADQQMQLFDELTADVEAIEALDEKVEKLAGVQHPLSVYVERFARLNAEAESLARAARRTFAAVQDDYRKREAAVEDRERIAAVLARMRQRFTAWSKGTATMRERVKNIKARLLVLPDALKNDTAIGSLLKSLRTHAEASQNTLDATGAAMQQLYNFYEQFTDPRSSTAFLSGSGVRTK